MHVTRNHCHVIYHIPMLFHDLPRRVSHKMEVTVFIEKIRQGLHCLLLFYRQQIKSLSHKFNS